MQNHLSAKIRKSGLFGWINQITAFALTWAWFRGFVNQLSEQAGSTILKDEMCLDFSFGTYMWKMIAPHRWAHASQLDFIF